jgi:competence protein ComEA
MAASEPDPLGSPDDVLARLRLRARLTRNEAIRLAEHPGPGRRGQGRFRLGVNRWALLGVALTLVVVAGSFMAPALGARQGDGASDGAPGVAWETEPEETSARSAPPGAVVYVTGAVNSPGVFELAAGARVADAIDRAGGALAEADLTVLNLAALVVDGERIYVPRPGEAPPAVIGPGGGGGAASGLVNVNAASAEELTALPGIGPVLAQRIVDHRDKNGPYTGLADLGEVSGIGPKILDSLADAVAF